MRYVKISFAGPTLYNNVWFCLDYHIGQTNGKDAIFRRSVSFRLLILFSHLCLLLFRSFYITRLKHDALKFFNITSNVIWWMNMIPLKMLIWVSQKQIRMKLKPFSTFLISLSPSYLCFKFGICINEYNIECYFDP